MEIQGITQLRNDAKKTMYESQNCFFKLCTVLYENPLENWNLFRGNYFISSVFFCLKK